MDREMRDEALKAASLGSLAIIAKGDFIASEASKGLYQAASTADLTQAEREAAATVLAIIAVSMDGISEEMNRLTDTFMMTAYQLFRNNPPAPVTKTFYFSNI